MAGFLSSGRANVCGALVYTGRRAARVALRAAGAASRALPGRAALAFTRGTPYMRAYSTRGANLVVDERSRWPAGPANRSAEAQPEN